MREHSIRYLMFLPAMLAVVGCVATGPADDGWKESDGFKSGGGVFSGEQGSYQFSIGARDKAGKKAKEQSENQPVPESPDEDFADYQLFLEWREAKNNNSTEYQRFLKWLEFEEYHRAKHSQD